MKPRTERVIIAATAIVLASGGGMVGPVLGAVATDLALQQLKKKAATTAMLLVSPAAAQSTAYEIIDGDTIRSPAGITYRVMGFDNPETFRSRCHDELVLGMRAKTRLEAVIASGEVQLIEHRLDRYGRTLATLTVNGRHHDR